VQDEPDHHLTVLLGLSDIVPSRTGQHLPIEQAGVVPTLIGPVLAELHSRPKLAAVVQTGKKALHNHPGYQGQARYRIYDLGGHRIALGSLGQTFSLTAT